ncbi:unnamed protein product [Linum trigynum]|uniref:Uncharacterized protein n=1 Tax=Linum trigynum TaxID=586398 RepID=A0AAV2DFB2_9ROSI
MAETRCCDPLFRETQSIKRCCNRRASSSRRHPCSPPSLSSSKSGSSQSKRCCNQRASSSCRHPLLAAFTVVVRIRLAAVEENWNGSRKRREFE